MATTLETLRYAVRTPRNVEDAVRAVQQALARRGFGVLWTLDVNRQLEEKGLALRDQVRILEVCSAPRALQALETNPAVALLLPCKVVVSARDGETEIALPRPMALLALVGDPRLEPLAAEVDALLRAAVEEAAGA
jgi:uncharacterized protein (DUF302 family)